MAARKQSDIIHPDQIQSFIDKFQKAQRSNSELRRYTKESLDWFRKRISKDLKLSRTKMLNDHGNYRTRRGTEKSIIGRLYYFEYKAAGPGDLDLNVYDRYPMVFVFNTSKTEDGNELIHALNVHYLQPTERAVLYTKLMEVRNRKGWTDDTKLNISWQIIKGLVDHPIYEKAVHAYRVDRLRSRMIEMHPSVWELCCFLRLELWIKADTHTSAGQKSVRKSHRSK